MSAATVTCATCHTNPAVAYVNDRPVCAACGGRELYELGAAAEGQRLGVIVDVDGAACALDVRPVESRPAFSGGAYGLGTCGRCTADAIVLLNDEPLCLCDFERQLAETRATIAAAP